MPDLSKLVLFHSGQVKNFYILSWDKYKQLMQFCISFLINYHELKRPCCMQNIVDPDQLASSADLDLHCFQLSLYLVTECTHGISKIRAKLSSSCIICSLGQVKF